MLHWRRGRRLVPRLAAPQGSRRGAAIWREAPHARHHPQRLPPLPLRRSPRAALPLLEAYAAALTPFYSLHSYSYLYYTQHGSLALPPCLLLAKPALPSASHDELPLPDARFFEFAEQMRQGLQKSEKKYRSRSWPAAFHGSDAITWVQKALNLTSRDMASKVATEIMERVRIHHLATGHRGECLACDLSRAGSVCTLLSDPRRVRSTT